MNTMLTTLCRILLFISLFFSSIIYCGELRAEDLSSLHSVVNENHYSMLREDSTSDLSLSPEVGFFSFLRGSNVRSRGARTGFTARLTSDTDGTICFGSTVELRANITGATGGGAYKYTWKLVDSTTFKKSTDTNVVVLNDLESRKYAYDFYCEIETAAGTKSVSDTISIYVQNGAIANIINPTTREITICYGDTIPLEGESRGVPPSYSWYGSGIETANTAKSIKVAPRDTAIYIFKAMTANCVTSDTVVVNVYRPYVSIPSLISAFEGDTLHISALNSIDSLVSIEKNALIWSIGNQPAVHTNPLELIPTENVLVKLKDTTMGCETVDSSYVSIKKLSVFKGGDDDGYSESSADFRVIVSSSAKNNTVCRGAGTLLTTTITADDSVAYSYEWKKVGDSSFSYADDSTGQLVLQDLQKTDEYYCRVSNGVINNSSDTLLLKVVEGSAAIITFPTNEDGYTICYGDSVELTGSVKGDVSASLFWLGTGIGIGNENDISITVAPKDTATYILEAETYGCTTFDTAVVNVYRPYVSLQAAMASSSFGAEVQLVAFDKLGDTIPAAGESLIWRTKDGVIPGSPNPYIFTGEKELVVNVMDTTSGCESYDSIFVSIKQKEVFEGGDHDGYSLSENNFIIKLANTLSNNSTCVGGTVRIETKITHDAPPSTFIYHWHKIGVDTTLCKPTEGQSNYTISTVKTSDAGLYYCLVNDGSIIRSSDTLELNVVELTNTGIVYPDTNAVRLCYGDTLKIEGSGDIYGTSMLWTGGGFVTEVVEGEIRGHSVLVSPKDTALYILRIGTGDCEKRDSIYVNVYNPYIYTPSIESSFEGSEVSIFAKDETGNNIPTTKGTLTWYNGTDEVKGRNPFKFIADSNVLVRVKYDYDNCDIAWDSTYVLAKTLANFKSGDGDGYSYSAHNFAVKLSSNAKNNFACAKYDLTFTANIESEANSINKFTYTWYKVGKDGVVLYSTDENNIFTVPEAKLSDADGYYCIVNNGTIKIVSDTLEIFVKTGLIAEIEERGDSMVFCYGDTTTLKGRTGPQGTLLLWHGSQMLSNFITVDSIKVSPKDSTFYVLEAQSGNCSTYDTIYFDVRSPYVHTIPIVSGHSGEEISLFATDMYGDTINAQKDTLKWRNSKGTELASGVNPYIFRGDDDITINANYHDSICFGSSSTFVAVREMDFFVGGSGDGYVQTEPNFEIVLSSDAEKNNVCEKADVLLTATISDEKKNKTYTYIWYKDEAVTPFDTTETNTLTLKNYNATAKYYCAVSDGRISIESNKLELIVLRGNIAKIIVPDTSEVQHCYGDTLTLEGLGNTDKDINSILSWSGTGIVSLGSDSSKISVSPLDTTVYILESRAFNCVTYASIKVNVHSAYASTPPIISGFQGENVTVVALSRHLDTIPLNSGTFEWFTDGVEAAATDNFFTFKAEKDVDIKLTYTSLDCKIDASSYVAIKPIDFFTGGIADGYSEAGSTIVTIRSTPPNVNAICEKTDVRLTATIEAEILSTTYIYAWWKVGDNTPLLTTSDSASILLPDFKVSDVGSYYCIVSDAGLTIKSNELALNIITPSTAGIVIPKPDTINICYGDTLTVKGRGDVTGLGMSWSGHQILTNDIGDSIVIAPKDASTYILKVGEGECEKLDTLTVNVYYPNVNLPTSYSSYDGEEVSLTALTNLVDTTKKLTWYMGDAIHGEKKNPLVFTAEKDVFVRVVDSTDNCRAVDSVFVSVKSVPVFKGGDSDGYSNSESIITTRISFLQGGSAVCKGGSVSLKVDAIGEVEGNLNYEWRKVGSNVILLKGLDETIYTETFDTVVSSGYYCLVSNGIINVTTDTLQINVIEGAIATITPNVTDTLLCYGETMLLSGEGEGLTSTLRWHGHGILSEGSNGSTIRVSPKDTAIYILEADSEVCRTYDTIRVNVEVPYVFIPDVIAGFEKEMIKLEALNQYGDTIVALNENLTWYNNNIEDGHGSFYSFSAEGNVTIRVKYKNKACHIFDTSYVSVRTYADLQGGDADGYDESCPPPIIIKQKKTIANSCDDNTTNQLVVVAASDNVTYKWQRLDPVDNEFKMVIEDSSKYDISGITDSVLVFKSISTNINGEYRCLVYSADCEGSFSVSEIFDVVLEASPNISKNLTADTKACYASTYSTGIKAIGGGLVYTWYIQERGSNSRIIKEAAMGVGDYESESSLDFPVELSYDSSLIWCSVSNDCAEVLSDSTILRLHPVLELEMSTYDTTNCIGVPTSIQLELKNGTAPWNFSYFKVGDIDNKVDSTWNTSKDTLVFESSGNYIVRFDSHADKCNVAIGDSIIEIGDLSTPIAKLSAVGDTVVCIGKEVQLQLNIEIPEGEDETGVWEFVFEDENGDIVNGDMDLLTPFRITTIDTILEKFSLIKDMTVSIRSVVDITNRANCPTASEGDVTFKVITVGGLNFDLKDNSDTIGICNKINLEEHLNPSIPGGSFFINNKLAENNIFDVAKLGEGWHNIRYEIIAETCGDSAKIKLYVVGLPVLSVTKDTILCFGEKVDVNFTATGAGPFTLVGDIENVKRDGSTDKNEFLRDKLPTTISVVHSAEIDSLRRITTSSLTDRFGCKAENLSKTEIVFQQKSKFEIRARIAGSNESWNLEPKDLSMNEGQKMTYEINYTEGITPWSLVITTSKGDTIVKETFKDKKSHSYEVTEFGEYTFFVQGGSHCGTNYESEISPQKHVSLTLTAFLQGPLDGTSMRTDLHRLGLLNAHLKDYFKDSVVSPADSIVDIILVELRPDDINSKALAQDTFLLRKDGRLLTKSGSDSLSFSVTKELMLKDSCYVVLHHRNHLSIVSSKMISANLDSVKTNIDFTDPNNIYLPQGADKKDYLHIFGRNGSKCALLAGLPYSVQQLISISNPNKVRSAKASMVDTVGYYTLDVNMNGKVEFSTPFLRSDAHTDFGILLDNRDGLSAIKDGAIEDIVGEDE